jgi:hypothetical protein
LTLEELAKIAPIGTVIIALSALGVATWSLLAQKGVTRRRAVIDFFLKTEMDEKLLIAYDVQERSRCAAKRQRFRRIL